MGSLMTSTVKEWGPIMNILSACLPMVLTALAPPDTGCPQPAQGNRQRIPASLYPLSHPCTGSHATGKHRC